MLGRFVYVCKFWEAYGTILPSSEVHIFRAGKQRKRAEQTQSKNIFFTIISLLILEKLSILIYLNLFLKSSERRSAKIKPHPLLIKM